MQGVNHSITAGSAWAALATPALVANPTSLLAWTGFAGGILIAGGGALANDFDHKGTTISNSLGFVTRGISSVINAISGGHRKGTHSILGVLIFAGLMWLSSVIVIGEYRILPTIISIIFAALFFEVVNHSFLMKHVSKGAKSIIKFVGIMSTVALTWTFAEAPNATNSELLDPAQTSELKDMVVMMFTHPMDFMNLILTDVEYGGYIFVVAATVGFIVHILGDFLTTEGIPPLYPFNKTHIKFPILGNTGSGRENAFTICCVIAVVCFAAFEIYMQIT